MDEGCRVKILNPTGQRSLLSTRGVVRFIAAKRLSAKEPKHRAEKQVATADSCPFPPCHEEDSTHRGGLFFLNKAASHAEEETRKKGSISYVFRC